MNERNPYQENLENVLEKYGRDIVQAVKDGKIAINDLIAGQKTAVDFTVHGKQNYAMGVKVYGN